jgi:hypothetical protein
MADSSSALVAVSASSSDDDLDTLLDSFKNKWIIDNDTKKQIDSYITNSGTLIKQQKEKITEIQEEYNAALDKINNLKASTQINSEEILNLQNQNAQKDAQRLQIMQSIQKSPFSKFDKQIKEFNRRENKRKQDGAEKEQQDKNPPINKKIPEQDKAALTLLATKKVQSESQAGDLSDETQKPKKQKSAGS